MPHTPENDPDGHQDGFLNSASNRDVGVYPDDMHPGLVPGISVDEQRNRFGLDKIVFSITAVLIV